MTDDTTNVNLGLWEAKLVKPAPDQLNILKLVLEQNGRLLEANIRLMEVLMSPPIVMTSVDKEQTDEGH